MLVFFMMNLDRILREKLRLLFVRFLTFLWECIGGIEFLVPVQSAWT